MCVQLNKLATPPKKAAEKKTVKREIRLSFMGPLCACTVDDKQKRSGKTRPVCIIFASFSTKEELSGMRFHDLIIIRGTRYHDTLILLFDTKLRVMFKTRHLFLQATFSFLSLKFPKNLRAARAIKIDWWVSGDWPMHYCLLMVSVTRAKKFKNLIKVRVFRIANGFRYGLTFWYRVCV